jgi:hypothetical protein
MVTRALPARLSSASRGGSARGAERCWIAEIDASVMPLVRGLTPREAAFARALARRSRDAIIAGSVARWPFRAGQFGRRWRSGASAVEHDPEKWRPVFRQDHAQTLRRSPGLAVLVITSG